MKIVLVVGTRPEIIKMASIIDEINNRGLDLVIIHTGQHYNTEMSEQMFLDLDLPMPQYNIGVGSSSHAIQTADVIKNLEKIFLKEKPNVVLAQGDTNAVLSGALVASKLHIPIGHVEAGLRSYDKTMPEEINRLVADVCSDYYYVPTEESALNLVSEGVNPKKIIITGNTVVDVCLRNLEIAKKKSKMPIDINSYDNLVTLTMHRAEIVDDKGRITQIVDALLELKEINIIFPIHPRTKKNLEKFNLYTKLEQSEHINLIKPLGYLDFLLLMSKSCLIITDSGGLQEEAITLNIPCLTLRYNTERPETVTAGGNILVGSDKDKIINKSRSILNNEVIKKKMEDAVNPYGNGNSSKLILNHLIEKYNNDELKVKAPNSLMLSFTRKLSLVTEDITVSDYENKNNVLIKTVFDNGVAKFPHKSTNLKDKHIFFDEYEN